MAISTISMVDDIIGSTRYDAGYLKYERPAGRDTIEDRVMTIVVRLANAQGWDVAQLAESSGMPDELVQRLLDSNAKINLEDINRFALAFGVTLFDVTAAAEHVMMADASEAVTGRAAQ